ncbi:hypothetical protein GIB67_040596 [Kingdonia uniflora]|uniref:Pentatricopeptide repeat-containing protein n=1 Tax=Kingdonia uniflora TaxID=39325 RepID=A0A7J7M8X1_9MAGN|nr:hypothetical protein GIB67_040596 [Kingdonia uniflora]
MITAYASHPNHHSSSLTLYRNMVRNGYPKPNHFVYPNVLKCCSGFLETNETKCVHAQIVKWGYGGYLIVQTALVHAYLRWGSNVGVARELFDEMLERNVVSWTAMVSGYARVGMIGNAIELFEEMPERDVPSWNALISGCTQNGLFSEGVALFRRMMEDGYDQRPNQVTVVCVLSACGHLGMLQLGRWIHGYIYRNDLGLNSFVSNALVDMYGKCGSLSEARRVFDSISVKNLTSWNSMINCLALHGRSDSAVSTFEEMMSCGGEVRPDGITFVGLLNACTHGGLVDQGYKYFYFMIHDYLIEPEIEHYGCVIDLLGRAGKFEELIEIIRNMKIDPDEVVWGSLLNACRLHGRMDLAELAVNNLIEINPNNAVYGIMLANIYGELGKWDQVGKVRKILKDQRVHKTPGCSWIEIDKQVHQFYSMDKTHSKTEEIYETLDIFAGII